MATSIDTLKAFNSLTFPKYTGEFNAFIEGYCTALQWSSSDGEHENLDDFFTADETDDKMITDCIEFLGVAGEIIDKACEKYVGYNWSQAGHDFALTRNGHGAGFWGRGIGEEGDELTRMSEEQGSVDLYVGDDELIYQG